MIEIAVQKTLNSPGGKMLLQVDLTIPEGNFVSLFGKSGAGKTSLLRIISGLLAPEEGQIKVKNNTWLATDQKINWSPQERKVGFVFQDYALFPNMTIYENLAFALAKGQDKSIVEDLIALVELGALQNRKPATLSGGQKQRVALARALVQKPQLLLLDEPLSALDHEMREKLQGYLLQVHREFGLTTILISHDRAEIIKLSDQVFLMEMGKVIQEGSPQEVFAQQIVGDDLQLSGQLVGKEKIADGYLLQIEMGTAKMKFKVKEAIGRPLEIGDQLTIYVKALEVLIQKR